MPATGYIIRRRIAVCMAAFLMLFMALGARLFSLQVLQSESLQTRAQAQWTSESIIEPRRGTIFDRNGQALAMSATAYIASVSPRQVSDAESFANLLAPILNMSEETILARASDTSKGGVTLKRQLARDVAQQLRSMYLEHRSAGSEVMNGLYLEEDSKRYYPLGAFASQLIGLTTVDGVGQSGLEASLNKYLSGKTGRILDEVDGKGRELSSSAREYVAAVDGASVSLTIDYAIQSFVEKAAREAMAVNNAKGVRILVMNPRTGEILAMCSKPDYNPNDPPRSDVALLTELMRNRVITDAYEPGSTFKIITSASALDAGLTSVSEGFYCSGVTSIDGSRVRCWGRPHGAQSMAQGLCNSCNPVFVELGVRLGCDLFYDYLEAFGFGSVTEVDIPGEAGGILIPRSSVKRVDIARVGFGQSIAVTPLQLLTAASAAVNGGNLMRPYVVREITAEDGTVLEKGEPEVVGKPISEATSATMRALLEKVVAEGGGRNAYIEGYRIGGKTGTAQVYKDGIVSTDTHIGSFLGFAPIDDPAIAVLVIVDEADVPSDFGSVTAAPFAKEIIGQTLAYLGYTKVLPREKAVGKTIVPDVSGLTTGKAIAALKAAGLQYLLGGAGANVVGQLPPAGEEVDAKSIVMLYVDGEADALANAFTETPDVFGLSISEANRLLASYGLKLEISGSGVATSQEPVAGETIVPSSTVHVIFETPRSGEILEDGQ